MTPAEDIEAALESVGLGVAAETQEEGDGTFDDQGEGDMKVGTGAGLEEDGGAGAVDGGEADIRDLPPGEEQAGGGPGQGSQDGDGVAGGDVGSGNGTRGGGRPCETPTSVPPDDVGGADVATGEGAVGATVGNYLGERRDDGSIIISQPSRRAKSNLEAIRLVVRLEEENRFPTEEEQQVLVRYAGWGGLKGVFAEHPKRDYIREYPKRPRVLRHIIPQSNNLVIEHLRAIRATLSNIERELGAVRHRVSSMEHHSANLQTDMANMHLRMDRQGERLDRIDRHLELVD